MRSRLGTLAWLASLASLAGCSLTTRVPRARVVDGEADCSSSYAAPAADTVLALGLAAASIGLLTWDCPEDLRDNGLGGTYDANGFECVADGLGAIVLGAGTMVGSVAFAAAGARGYAAASKCRDDARPPEPVVPPPVVARAEPAPVDAELDRLVAVYSSGVPECDAYVRAFAAMSRCPVLAARATIDGRRTMLLDMMARFAEQGRLDPVRHATAREQAARRCQSGTDEVRATLRSLSCTVEPGS